MKTAGISMHKGYAFVQFTNPFDARGACLGEDGRTVLGQTLDVNMVAEPKPHQTGRKRQNVAKTGNDWDYYYDSYYASAGFGGGRLVPPLKRPRMLMTTPTRPAKVTVKVPNSPHQVKTYSNPDILICGNCREMFTELQELLDHKKEFCKLRFTCKCSVLNGSSKDIEEGVTLTCVQCKEPFSSAWDLMVHVQAAHMLNIYELAPKEDRFAADQDNKECEEAEMIGQGSDDDLANDNLESSCLVGALTIETTNGGVSAGQMSPVTNGQIKASAE
nr:RNA-binding protein Raly [Halyomorpha halys]